MSNAIEIYGIETNNLKNIDIKLKKRAINLILGPSGSGKSSLAYDTIAQIGIHEMNSLFSDDVLEPTYKVRSYQNMLATVPLPQVNHNNNIRSTIGTYFGISRHVALIYSVILKLNQDFFTLNKEENVCDECHGLGVVKELDINLIIDYNAPLEHCPFKCWMRSRDFYSQIIKCFCDETGISCKKNFRALTNSEKQAMLYGESDGKFVIKYKKSGIKSTRTTKYHGPMTGIPMLPKFTYGRQFFSDKECTKCKGKKYSSKHDAYKIQQYAIGEFLRTPFHLLHGWMESIAQDAHEKGLSFSLNHLSNFIKKSTELGLGHLSFNRSIPTLSGGELQRLRLVQLFNTQLSDLLIVLDEPLAGLSNVERLSVYHNILELLTRHTAVIVDHHDTFVSNAEVVIALGEKSGRGGGKIIASKQYLDSQKIDIEYTPLPIDNVISIQMKDSIYNYNGIDITIAEHRLNIIIGKSGIGKSTLLREYFRRFFERYTYINQKPLLGNKNSSIATLLDILNPITADYAKYFDKEKRFFSNINGGQGVCKACGGDGYIEYGGEYQLRAHIKCKECSGTGFNKNLKKYKISGVSLFDIWDMTVEDAARFYHQVNPKIALILDKATELMLGHLLIGQATSTLSGGENIRIKLLKSLSETATVYGIDEPFRGLGNLEILNVIDFLKKLTDKNKTIIVADHEEESFRFFSNRILLTNQENKLVGVGYESKGSSLLI